MFAKIRRNLNQKRLKDDRYNFLFDKPPDNEYICFDVESTGLDPKADDIISIAAVKIKGNKILSSQKFERLVNTDKSLSAKNIEIHRLRVCDLEYGEDIKSVIEDFLHFIGSRKLVGYYLEFDVSMVNKYLRNMLGITLPNEQIEVSAIYYDQKIEFIPQGHVDLRFDIIMKDLKLPMMSKHDSLNDAIMTAMIFLKLKFRR
jgi:DNA polymerase-3 subunit epsilon